MEIYKKKYCDLNNKKIKLYCSKSLLIKIGSGFIWYYFSLTTIDLSGLSNITIIGNNFLSLCSNLSKIKIFDKDQLILVMCKQI